MYILCTKSALTYISYLKMICPPRVVSISVQNGTIIGFETKSKDECGNELIPSANEMIPLVHT